MPEDAVDVLHRRVHDELQALDLDPRTLPTPALKAAIRGRRRATTWGAAGAGALVVAGAAFAVPALVPTGPSTVAVPGGTVTPTPAAGPPACGRPFVPATGLDALSSTSMKEPFLPVDGPGIVGLTFTLTNPTAAPLQGSAGYVDVYVVQDGHVVAMPGAKREIALTVDLAPQASMPIEGSIALQDCRPGRPEPAATADGPPVTLPAGTYELYGETTVFTASGDRTVVRGGPWPLTLR